MKYFITKLGTIIDENNNRVDLIEGTENYNNYVKFLQAGGTLEETENLSAEDLLLLKEVPEEITALQFFKQLLIMGITKDAIRYKAQQMFDAGLISEMQLELIDLFLTNATKILRKDDIMELFKSAFDLTDEHLDNLFIEASKL